MKHFVKSTKSVMAILLAAAFLCGGAAASARTENISTTTEKVCLQGLSSDIMLADDWDCSNFI